MLLCITAIHLCSVLHDILLSEYTVIYSFLQQKVLGLFVVFVLEAVMLGTVLCLDPEVRL